MAPLRKPTARRLRAGDYACQYLSHDSPLHRLGAGWKMLVCTLLSGLAVGARTPVELLGLVLATLAWYFAARLTPADLWRDCRFFLVQAVIVIGLYCLKFGTAHGFWAGVRTSVLVILFFLPGAVLLRTTRTRDVMAGLRRVIPYRLSFLVFISIRFVPYFLRELESIAAAQRLRGARLSPRHLFSPRNWGELFNCLLLPLMVRALKTADEVALSAEARGFGLRSDRTYMNGDGAAAPVEGTSETVPLHTKALPH